MLGGVGQKLSLNKNTESTEPLNILVSDGTFVYPTIHHKKTYLIEKGVLLLDCNSKEYFEFETIYNEDIHIEFFRLNSGSRAKVYVYRNTTEDLVLTFDKLLYGPSQTLRLKGGKSVYIIEVEAIRDPSIDLSVRYIVKIDGQRYQSSPVFYTTIEIPTLEDFGSISKGTLPSELNGLTLNELIEKRLWKPSEAPVFYSPTLSLLPNNKTVEEGTTLTVNFSTSYNRRDGGNRSGLARLYHNSSYLVELPNTVEIPIYGRNEFYAIQDYLSGSQTKTTEDGVVWPNTIAEGKATSSKRILQGQRAIFYGPMEAIPSTSTEIRNLNRLIKGRSNQLIKLQTAWKNQLFVFAYPSSYGKLTFIKYVEGLGANVLNDFNNLQIDVMDASLQNPMKYEVYLTSSPLLYSSDVHYEFQF